MSGKTSTESIDAHSTRRAPGTTIPDDQLLFSRKQVMRMLGRISYPTIIRLEKAGKLPPVKLKHGRTCKAFYRRADVMALIEP